jgi:hypothetical protein
LEKQFANMFKKASAAKGITGEVLLQLLEARLDTLLYLEKLTLQRAAVLGRVFHDTALAAMDAVDEYKVENLDKVLETLVEREFIYRRQTTAFEGSIEYIF